jgi:hypothetical protein
VAQGYLQARALVDALDRRAGGSLDRLLSAWLQHRDLDRALRRVYRLDSAELEASLLDELL